MQNQHNMSVYYATKHLLRWLTQHLVYWISTLLQFKKEVAFCCRIAILVIVVANVIVVGCHSSLDSGADFHLLGRQVHQKSLWMAESI